MNQMYIWRREIWRSQRHTRQVVQPMQVPGGNGMGSGPRDSGWRFIWITSCRCWEIYRNPKKICNCMHPGKTKIASSNGKWTTWRCISFKKWRFCIAMLVYQRVCQKKKLPIRRFQLLEDVVPGGRAHGPQVAVPWTKMYDEKVKLRRLRAPRNL